MTIRVRCCAVLLICLLAFTCSSSTAVAQTTEASSAKVAQLLHGFGTPFTQKTPAVWYMDYNGKHLKDFRVILAVEGDLLVSFVTVAPKARIQTTPDFMHKVMRLNSRLDRVKIGLDSDEDLFVRIDSSVRIMDADEFKQVIDQLAAATDDVYDDLSAFITPPTSAK